MLYANVSAPLGDFPTTQLLNVSSTKKRCRHLKVAYTLHLELIGVDGQLPITGKYTVFAR